MGDLKYWITYTAPFSKEGRVKRHSGPFDTLARAREDRDDIAGYEGIGDVKIVTEDPTIVEKTRYDVLMQD